MRRGVSAKVIRRAFRLSQERLSVGTKARSSTDANNMAFYAKWNDRALELKDKEDKKLFNDAYRGLEKKDKFDGNLSKAFQFLKLIGKEEDCR